MNDIKTALRFFIVLTVLTGIVYPLAVTAVSQAAMPDKANGSLIVENGQVFGSRLIGQNFTEPGFFWGRPSATADKPYNAAASSGSNLGPTNPDLRKQIDERVQALRKADPSNAQLVPTDLVTSSGSGLDPDISVEAALYQVPRVARARGADRADIERLVEKHTLRRQLGILGEPRVRVLELNLDLDKMLPVKH